jgi:hypothetical protein
MMILWNSLALGSWLISAWLEMPHALKTFLENQFLFYKAGPSDVRFTIRDGVHSRLFTYVDFASKDRPIRNFTTAVASPERRMTLNKRIRVPQNTSFNHVRQPDKSHKPCFASLSVMHTGV